LPPTTEQVSTLCNACTSNSAEYCFYAVVVLDYCIQDEDWAASQKSGCFCGGCDRRSIYDDPFIAAYLDDLLKNIRTQVLLQLIKPYTCIGLPSIAAQLNIPETEVEFLCVSLILDNRIVGKIDQVTPCKNSHATISCSVQRMGQVAVTRWPCILATMVFCGVQSF
jgi:hypothetical protein